RFQGRDHRLVTIGDNIFEYVSTSVRITFGGIIASFTNERLGPFLAGLLLTLGILFLFYILVSYLISDRSLSSAIRSVKSASGTDEPSRRAAFAQRFDSIDSALFRIRRISNAWREFRETLLRPESADGKVIISNSSRPHVFFNLSSLHMNFHF